MALLAVLQVAAPNFGLTGCIGARIGQGIASLELVVESNYTITLWWRTGGPNRVYTDEALRVDYVRFNKLVDKDQWRNVTFVQLIFANDSDYDHDIEERPRKNYRSYLERAKKEGWIKTLADLRDPNIEQNVSASGRPPVVAKNLKAAIHYLVRHGVPAPPPQ